MRRPFLCYKTYFLAENSRKTKKIHEKRDFLHKTFGGFKKRLYLCDEIKKQYV